MSLRSIYSSYFIRKPHLFSVRKSCQLGMTWKEPPIPKKKGEEWEKKKGTAQQPLSKKTVKLERTPTKNILFSLLKLYSVGMTYTRKLLSRI